ncbi:hypothetical protein DEO72_LG8g2067 [Vigna unguiculata]|uniref:Uncharacterized protein n=1 Tax=Vigna unguiculata TaxID=3917 RepID=A0A4D6MVX0_VIGUN|nr:hypothetical protein DEO72_LG8g2067 [Vigna unguiculata]
MVALWEVPGGVKLRRFMARADAGVGAVEMAMVVARGAGCGMALVRELWRPEVHCGGCCVRKKNSRWFRDDGGTRAAGREKKMALLLRWCSGEVRRCGGSVKDSQVQARWLQLLFSSGGGAPRWPARLAAAAVWRVVMVVEIRVRVFGR